MKKNFMLAALFALTGAMTAQARYWTYEWDAAVAPTEIVAGQWYALQGGQSAADGGYTTWFNGTNHTTSENLTTDNLIKFVEAGKTTDGYAIYYMQRFNGEYLYAPGQTHFYGTAIERAWKVVVKEALFYEPDYEYTYEDPETGDESDLTGIAAYVAESKDAGEPIDLSNATYVDGENLIIIAGAESDGNDGDWSTYTYLTGLGKGATAGAVGKGTNYNNNTWVLFPATEQDAFESLRAKMFELTDGTYEIDLSAYQLGNGAGEYGQAEYDKFMALWERALAIHEGESATDAEMDEIAEALEPALDAFRNSGKGLSEGYYILYNKRRDEGDFSSAWPYVSNGSGYDAAAMYDGGAVNPKDDGLRWSCKDSQKGAPGYADDVDLYLDDDGEGHVSIQGGYTYDVAKFVWHAFKSGNKDNQGNDLYYFQNIETDRYIGNIAAAYQPIKMTDTPTTDYTIATNPYIPGWFCFYSPELPPNNDASAPSPAEYSGIHTERNNSNVVAWDWRNAGSCWKVITLTEDEVKELKANLEAPKRLAELKKLAAEAEKKIEDGYTYSGYDADGNRCPEAASGSVDVTGLVTDVSQVASEASHPDWEGEISNLVDGDESTYWHTNWSGGFAGQHYLQFTIENPEEALLIKGVKRQCNNYNNGAPTTFELWATDNEEYLDIVEGEIEDPETGETTESKDYWQTLWTKVDESEFNYKYRSESTYNFSDNNVGTAFTKSDKPYQFFRLVPTGRVTNNNVWFYFSEFRVYRGALDMENSLITAVPENVLKALQDAIALAQEEITDGEATQGTLDALQKAYDAFLEYYPEPTRVTNALNGAEALANTAEEGEGLGYYTEGSVDKLKAVIEDVRNGVKEVMTVEEINNLLAQLNAALDEFNASLRVPATGYYVVTSKSNNETNYGRAICATTSSEKQSVRLAGGSSEDGTEARPGRYWYVEKTEGGYTYKNLYTGKYLHPVNNTVRNLALSAEPYVFAIQFAKEPGCFNLIMAKEDAVGGEHIYANADPAGVLVAWNTAEGRDNSAWEFNAVEASEVEEAVKEGVLIDIPYAAPQIFTFPIDIDTYDAPGSFYSVVGQSENFDIQLAKEEDILAAGQPYVFVPAETTGKVARFYLPEDVEFTKLTATSVAKSKNGLFGVFEVTELPNNCGVFNDKHTEVLVSEEGETVAPNTGYFAQMPEVNEKGAYTLKANGKMTAENAAISAVIVDNTKKNFIFSVSGVRMNSTEGLPAGLYIINGKKYLVK